MNYTKIPYKPEEMQSQEYYPLRGNSEGILKPAYPISSKENLLRAIAGDPVWIPSDMEVLMFAPATIGEHRVRGMVSEAMKVPMEEFGGKDFFGVEWVYEPEQGGSMVVPGNPLLEDAGEWYDKVIFPDMSKWDWEECAKRNETLLKDGRMIKTPVYTGFFERLVSFMDMEGALVALIDEEQQDDVKALFDRLADFYIELIANMRKYFHIDIVWFHDDWGSQRAPMFSYGTVEEMILPYLKKVVAGAHEAGVLVEFHSCGKIEPLFPLILESGADLWDGQEMNDKVAISRMCQGRMSIGVQAQMTPPMNDEEARSCVRELLDTYPAGIFLGKTFRADPRLTPMAYEESRKLYNGICK